MDAHLIFYCANQVYNNEDAITNGLKRAKVNISNINAVFTDEELAESVKKSISKTKILLICLNISKDKDNVKEIISNALQDDYSIKSDKKISLGGDILQGKKSTIILLPDNPEDIAKISEDDLLGYISRSCKIRLTSQQDNDDITDTLIKNINDSLENHDFSKDNIINTNISKSSKKFLKKLVDNIGIVFLIIGVALLVVIIILAILGNIS